MANSEDYDEDRDDFEDVRHDLNLDEGTMEDALRTYREIKVNFRLEGEKMDWIACAIYSSCRSRTTQTMGRSKIEGNGVSLTRILRSCKISLARFFSKMKNWMAMARLSQEMRNKLDQLERNFNVTSVIFKKYKPMFEDIFKCIENKTCRFGTKKPKSLRKQPLTSLDIFTFCWTLFVYIKSRYSQINDDLVNSYHLLVVCLDYCYSCVLSFDNYKDIVNSNFYDALAKDLTTDPRSHNNDNRVSIIDTICAKWNGIEIEVKQIKKCWFEPFLKALTEKDGEPHIRKRPNGIIDCDVVDFNFKYFKREYETYVLSIGDFDECVFLNETASEELGTEEFNGELGGGGGSNPDNATIDSILLIRKQPKTFNSGPSGGSSRINHDQPNNIMPMTPLSSRDYLACRTPVNRALELTPISAATANISRIQSILMNQKDEPSEGLRELLAKCQQKSKISPVETIARMIKEMGDVFVAAFNTDNSSANNENNDPAAAVGVIRRSDELQYVVSDNFPQRRLELAAAFFYRVLENILNDELRKAKKWGPAFDATAALVRVLEQHVFLRSLFACSLEIVLHSYSPANRLFPWILNIYNNSSELKLHSYDFYKVIELIIRSEQLLSRELVKYLNTVEEAILERYAWTADSPVWGLLKQSAGGVPSFEETQSFNSPAPKIFASTAAAAAAGCGGNIVSLPGISIGRTAPVRKLNFGGSSEQEEVAAAPATDAHQIPNGSVTVKSESDEPSIKSLSEHQQQNGGTPVKQQQVVNSSQQLKLFFRKVYNVALLRLRDLTRRLGVKEDHVQMMWTCLLHALRSHTELMCEHHLDQLIMCSVYCICKLNVSHTFADIVKEYRLQPQAKNYVYRNVLLNIRNPTVGESSSSDEEQKDVKTGDLIKFYNQFFIPRLTEAYILNFRTTGGQRQNVTLSPLPSRTPLISPLHHLSPIRRVANSTVFVSPLPTSISSSCPLSPGPSYRIQYSTTFSASTDLRNFNSQMQSLAREGRNNGIGGTGNAKRAAKRLQDVLEGGDGSSGSSGSSQGPGGKMLCLDRKIKDILVDRNQIQQFSAAAVASSASVSGVEDNSNDSLQFGVMAGPSSSVNHHQLPMPEIRGMSPILTNGGSGAVVVGTQVVNVAAE